MSLKKHIITLVSLLLMSLTVFLLFLGFINNALNNFPDSTQVNLNLNAGIAPIKTDYFNKISDRVKKKYYSFTSEGETVKIKGEKVIPVYTTSSYFDLSGLKLKGTAFTEKDEQYLKRKVIISDTLALKLYFNADAVGEIFTFEGEDYIVSGVYEDSKKPIDMFSKDTKERIYLPYTCFPSPDTLPVHTIVYDTHSSTASVIEQMYIPQYHYQSLSEKTQVLSCVKRLMYFALYIGFSIILLLLWYKTLKYLLKEIGHNLKDNYFLKSVFSIPFKYILLTLAGIGIPALLIFVFIKSDFSIYIVSKYMPDDNIFDISHYVSKILENAHLKNSLALSGNTFLPTLYENTLNISLWLFALFLIFYISLLILLFSLIKNPKR